MYLRKACKKIDNITPSQFCNWLDNKEYTLNDRPLIEQYSHARERQADYYAEKILEVADTEEDVNRARLKVDSLKWIASKLKPKTWGDRQIVDQNVTITADIGERLARARKEMLAKHTGELIDVTPVDNTSE